MSEPSGERDKPFGLGLRSTIVLAIFVILGPPIAGLLALGLLVAASGGVQNFLEGMTGLSYLPGVAKMVSGSQIFLFPYRMFGFQLLPAGLVASFSREMSRTGKVSFRGVLLAYLLTAVYTVLIPYAQMKSWLDAKTVLGVYSCSVFAGTICCLICNLLLSDPRPSRAEQSTSP